MRPHIRQAKNLSHQDGNQSCDIMVYSPQFPPNISHFKVIALTIAYMYLTAHLSRRNLADEALDQQTKVARSFPNFQLVLSWHTH